MTQINVWWIKTKHECTHCRPTDLVVHHFAWLYFGEVGGQAVKGRTEANCQRPSINIWNIVRVNSTEINSSQGSLSLFTTGAYIFYRCAFYFAWDIAQAICINNLVSIPVTDWAMFGSSSIYFVVSSLRDWLDGLFCKESEKHVWELTPSCLAKIKWSDKYNSFSWLSQPRTPCNICMLNERITAPRNKMHIKLRAAKLTWERRGETNMDENVQGILLQSHSRL